MEPGLDRMTVGVLILFGSLLPAAPIGLLVGRLLRFDLGAAAGMLVFGLGGLVAAGSVASYFHLESVLVSVPPSGCIDRSALHPDPRRPRAWSADLHLLLTPDGRERVLQTPDLAVACSGDPPQPGTPPRLLRVYKADLQKPGAEPIPARPEQEPRLPLAGPAVLAAFGAFWSLAGLFMLATALRDARAARPEPVVGPLRRRLSTWAVVAGNGAVFGGLLLSLFAPLDGPQSTMLLFGAIAAACGLWGLSLALRGQLRLDNALVLLILGGGFAAAAASVQLFT
jgi:hypothetical protein